VLTAVESVCHGGQGSPRAVVPSEEEEDWKTRISIVVDYLIFLK
jgi:hypothetical protein